MHGDAKLGDILIARTEGQHGDGRDRRADGAGVRLRAGRARRSRRVYIAGDTILCDEVRARGRRATARDVIVVNASAAQFNEGGPIVMDNDDVVALAREAPDAQIVAVHFEAVSTAPRRARTCASGSGTRADRTSVVPEDGAAL